MNLEQLTCFFGWMTVINVVFLTVSSILIIALRKPVCRMHGKMFGISDDAVAIACYGYLGMYKVLVISLNLVPYIALQMVQ